MKIYYWSPFTSYVATIKAVINSAYSLKKYFYHDTYILNSFGEWNNFKKEIKNKNIKILENKKKGKIKFVSGYILSRILFVKIFIKSFFFLKNILKKNNPEYLIIHLITSLPLVLFFFYNFKTKLILRISGQPKFNFFRKMIWKLSKNNIHFVTVPTIQTLNKIKKMNIFDQKKLYYLPDPVFLKKEINSNHKKELNFNNKYILNVGRLTEQKNQKILINFFSKISKKYKKINLLILGEGEKLDELMNLAKKLNVEKSIKFLGHKKKVYQYINKSVCVIVSSLWEDPGFVMIESAALKKIVISSDCPSGPREFFNNGKSGFLFKNNNIKSLISTFDEFMSTDKKKIKKYIKINYINSMKYSEIEHSKNFNKLFQINEKR
ncbi:glycosyltransferase [Candidatus Pelagibacter sp. HIMB1506]|uniref:glycosyltransferase n=1 Tax=Candidatus Pelagibacter sp. HIMB1506 TaxID=3413337 RepID=UPI003F82AD43